jgi:hypothetical protein
MTVHNIRDYSPAPKTAANSTFEPEAPIWVKDNPPMLSGSPIGYLIAAAIGVFLALVIISLLPAPVGGI